jgi:deoxyribodipyrimidine photo-lyase
MSDGGTAIVWFRRDLRVGDHPALCAALERADRVIPFFCFDDRLLHGRHESGSRTQFMLECLTDLRCSLRDRGADLVLRHGRPERELPRLAREVGAREVHFTPDVSPFAASRDGRARRALTDTGVGLFAHPGLNVVDDATSVCTAEDRPYSVFSPFHRRWEKEPRRGPLEAPRSLPALPATLPVGALPTLSELRLESKVEDPLPGGERPGRERLAAFLDEAVGDYASNHDALGADRTSRLSPYIRFGCVSPREVEARLPNGKGAAAFRRQLAWRDFYYHVLDHFPRNARSEFQERLRGRIRWSHARKRFEAWTDGRTGYPLVDAGMRQLRREGWMHNRARLVVGSFLTKDLGIDWRWGERWFMRLLIDGDEANNNGNWQWIASVGVDPQPAYRRIYNPARHMERFDPRGDYVRRYVPELRDVPDEHLREPWKMPAAVQREAGCVVGRDYPEPIVDHAEARGRALERYATAGLR